MAIQIDPESGLKIFNTRAGKATEKIAGKGYSALRDESLTSVAFSPKIDLNNFSSGLDEVSLLGAVSYTHLTLPTNREV